MICCTYKGKKLEEVYLVIIQTYKEKKEWHKRANNFFYKQKQKNVNKTGSNFKQVVSVHSSLSLFAYHTLSHSGTRSFLP